MNDNDKVGEFDSLFESEEILQINKQNIKIVKTTYSAAKHSNGVVPLSEQFDNWAWQNANLTPILMRFEATNNDNGMSNWVRILYLRIVQN